jgi:peroxiredoxin
MAIFRLFCFTLLFAATGCSHTYVTQLPASSPTLRGSSGEPVAVSSLVQRRELLVVVFWSANCPCVRRYQARLQALTAKYSQVEFAAVVSNAGESFEDAQNEARSRGVTVPLYWDNGGQLASTLDATTTPTAVMFDREGHVLFFGWIDNEHDIDESSREPWLEQTIDRALAHSLDHPVHTTIFGCRITRPLHGASPKPADCGCEAKR